MHVHLLEYQEGREPLCLLCEPKSRRNKGKKGKHEVLPLFNPPLFGPRGHAPKSPIRGMLTIKFREAMPSLSLSLSIHPPKGFQQNSTPGGLWAALTPNMKQAGRRVCCISLHVCSLLSDLGIRLFSNDESDRSAGLSQCYMKAELCVCLFSGLWICMRFNRRALSFIIPQDYNGVFWTQIGPSFHSFSPSLPWSLSGIKHCGYLLFSWRPGKKSMVIDRLEHARL